MTTKTVEYLNRAKEKLGISSDYALAKVLDVHQAIVSQMMSEKKHATEDVAFKLAQILEEDERLVLAEIRAESAPTEKQKDWWRGFSSRVRHAAGIAALTTSVLYSGSYTHEAEASGGPRLSDISSHYAQFWGCGSGR